MCRFFQNIVNKERRRPIRFRHSNSYDVDKMEYLCPLCEGLSNTVIPIIPHLRLTQRHRSVSVSLCVCVIPIIPRLRLTQRHRSVSLSVSVSLALSVIPIIPHTASQVSVCFSLCLCHSHHPPPSSDTTSRVSVSVSVCFSLSVIPIIPYLRLTQRHRSVSVSRCFCVISIIPHTGSQVSVSVCVCFSLCHSHHHSIMGQCLCQCLFLSLSLSFPSSLTSA